MMTPSAQNIFRMGIAPFHVFGILAHLTMVKWSYFTSIILFVATNSPAIIR
jgi:hypothetical protein